VAAYSRSFEAVLVEVEHEGPDIVLRFEPLRGSRALVEDRIRLGPPGEMSTIQGVGRILRILRSARVRPPAEPYTFGERSSEAVDLLRRCIGARVVLHVTPRVERVLTVWTETGVDRISDVVDFGEDPDGLWVRRKGGQSVLRIPRRSLIRFSSTSHSRPQVVSLEASRKRELR
jgi:hypothetical protein